MSAYTTSNVYITAAALAVGYPITGVTVEGSVDGRPVVRFTLDAPENLGELYSDGRLGLVTPLAAFSALNHVRDRLYGTLRQARSGAAARWEGEER